MPAQILTAGQAYTWKLPAIDEGDAALQEVIVEISGALSTFVEFRESQKEFEFSDDLASKSLVG